MIQRLTDNQYLSGLRSRDSIVLENIYSQFFPGIAHYVQTNGGVKADAEDVFQEGLVVLFRKIKANELSLNSSFYTFFYAVCKRIWLNKQTRTRSIKTLPLAEEQLSEHPDEVILALEQSEQYQLYRNKFQLLGEDCRTLLQLFFKKVSMLDIAIQLGYASEGYAKKRKFICKQQLMQLIKADSRYQELRYSLPSQDS